ncbi:MAG: Asp-tRNA(Asn)/Glu-tRNA(Gln) amidotransferase subunit GatA [Acidobacteria bacterium]|nr:Asp-tRNA(Asn)/Glu-tRNA(Gln) amidotransferase subunit GatA [Acidobacteriota bacterium]
MNPTELNIDEISRLLGEGKISAVELAEAHFEKIRRRDPEVRAYLTLGEDRALRQAKRVDEKIAAGEKLPPLAGVPMGVKDVIFTRDIRTTCASKMLEHFVPPYDATAVERLDRAGAVFLGKLNCDEYAMGSSTENSAYFATRNPHDPERVPGGSSGGSAAAVAAHMAVASLGSDTGGSIRQPAAFCGVPGMMGTYGRVSRYGLVAFASSLDHIGPFGRTVRDLAHVLQAISGADPMDSTAAQTPVPDYMETIENKVDGVRIGIPKECFEGLEPRIGDNIQKGLALLEKQGTKLVPIRLPHTEYAVACYYIICTAEASSNLARYDGIRYGFRIQENAYDGLRDMYRKTRDGGFGAEVKRRIMLGTYALSSGYYDAYYRKAQKVRTLVTRDFLEAFEEVDIVLTPTSPFPAFKLGEKLDDPLTMYLADIYTVPASLAGLPGIAIPCGLTAAKYGKPSLPVGMQLIAPHFEEARLLQLARAFEKAGGFDLA